MDKKEISANSLSFIGDAIYTLKVREHFVSLGYQSSKKLQSLCTAYNSARGQMAVFNGLLEKGFFSDEELEIFKRGRNHITHIPKNGDLISYQIATGIEAVSGYLYLYDKERLEELFDAIFDGGFINV